LPGAVQFMRGVSFAAAGNGQDLVAAEGLDSYGQQEGGINSARKGDEQ